MSKSSFISVFLFSVFFWVFLFHNGQVKATDSLQYTSTKKPKSDSLKIVQLLDQAKIEVASDYKKAIVLALEANKIAIHTEDSELLMMTELNLGTLYFYLGLYEKATDYYTQILKMAEKRQYFEWMAKGYYQLGAIRLVMEDYELAKIHFLKSKEMFLKKTKNENLISLPIRLGFHNNLGVIYSGLGELEMAKSEFDAGIALLNDSSDLLLVRTQLLNNIGDVYAKKGDTATALKYYIYAKDQFQEVSDPRLEAMVNKSLGDVYMGQDNLDSALFYFRKSLVMANSFEGYSNLKHITNGLLKVYEKLDNKDSAFVYLQLSKTYEDSLNLKRTSEKILKEEMLLAFSEEKSQLKQFYDNNRAGLLGIIISLLLGLIVAFLRVYIIRINLKKAEIEKFKIGEIAKNTQGENFLLKETVAQNKKDMTLMSMNSIQNNHMLKQLSVSVHKKNKNGESVGQKDLERILNDLKFNQSDRTLSDFELRFGNVYVGFFEKLIREYPLLSLNERRLSAFLKLQLTTKEISAVTGQSVRAIEMGRTRLRKKLALTNSEKNLYDFFLEF